MSSFSQDKFNKLLKNLTKNSFTKNRTMYIMKQTAILK